VWLLWEKEGEGKAELPPEEGVVRGLREVVEEMPRVIKTARVMETARVIRTPRVMERPRVMEMPRPSRRRCPHWKHVEREEEKDWVVVVVVVVRESRQEEMGGPRVTKGVPRGQETAVVGSTEQVEEKRVLGWLHDQRR
jgi:hypothetical protein